MGTALHKSKSTDTNVETYSLIWLDANVHTSKENIGYKERLQTSINELHPFDKVDECMNYIQSLTCHDRIILISSGRLGSTIVPRIHNFKQIYSIYVFCQNKSANEKWARNYKKVRGVFTNIGEMIEQILYDQHAQNCKVDEEISVGIFHREHMESRDQMNTYNHFVYSKILIDTLLQISITDTERNELYIRCKKEYQLNRTELQQINEFENKYTAKEAIRWFTRTSFLSKMLNKALRIQNVNLLFLFRFFIRDIQYQIDKYKYSSIINVYRSQLMSKDDLQKFKDSLGQFISINSFLWALSNRTAAMSILNKTTLTEDTERVLFEIHADGSLQAEKSFSCIKSDVKNSPEEFLFSIGSIFRLMDVRPSAGNIWIIQITLCTDDDPLLQPLIEDIYKKYGDTKTSPYSFGLILRELHMFDEATNYYQRLTKVFAENPQRIQECESVLDQIFIDQENFKLSVSSIFDNIDASLKNSKMTGYSQALNHIHDGKEYQENGELELSLQCYQKAIKILIESNNEEHLEVGRCYKQIALLYQENKDYNEALIYYEKAKNNLQNNLGSHPDLSEIYIKIGDIYHQHLVQYDQALENYDKAIEVAERISIPQFALIVTIRKKMASVCKLRGDLPNALVQYENIALLLPAIHENPKQNNENIQQIRSQIQ